MDNRNNFHLLAHRYDYRDGYPANPNQTMPVLVSGHGFSTDGATWHFNSEQQPYDAQITFVNGTTQLFSTWERPHLVFDPHSGLPTHLVNGVQASQPQRYITQHTWALACKPFRHVQTCHCVLE